MARFNEFAASGKDLDFRRGDFAYDREWPAFPPIPKSSTSMYGSITSGGGAVINERAQVFDVTGRPIPGLYGAVNCIASPSASAYWGEGASLGLATTVGYIAAMSPVKEEVRRC